MVLDKRKWTTMSVAYEVKEQLDNLIIVSNGVPLRFSSDKVAYLLYFYEMHSKKN